MDTWLMFRRSSVVPHCIQRMVLLPPVSERIGLGLRFLPRVTQGYPVPEERLGVGRVDGPLATCSLVSAANLDDLPLHRAILPLRVVRTAPCLAARIFLRCTVCALACAPRLRVMCVAMIPPRISLCPVSGLSPHCPRHTLPRAAQTLCVSRSRCVLREWSPAAQRRPSRVRPRRLPLAAR